MSPSASGYRRGPQRGSVSRICTDPADSLRLLASGVRDRGDLCALLLIPFVLR